MAGFAGVRVRVRELCLGSIYRAPDFDVRYRNMGSMPYIYVPLFYDLVSRQILTAQRLTSHSPHHTPLPKQPKHIIYTSSQHPSSIQAPSKRHRTYAPSILHMTDYLTHNQPHSLTHSLTPKFNSPFSCSPSPSPSSRKISKMAITQMPNKMVLTQMRTYTPYIYIYICFL